MLQNHWKDCIEQAIGWASNSKSQNHIKLLCGGQQRFMRLPWSCCGQEHGTLLVNQRLRSHDREGSNWTLKPGVQLLSLPQLLLDNHGAEDWMLECGCRKTLCLHDRVSSRQRAKVAERGFHLTFIFQVSSWYTYFGKISFAIKPYPARQPLQYGKVECSSTISNTVRVVVVTFWAWLL